MFKRMIVLFVAIVLMCLPVQAAHWPEGKVLKVYIEDNHKAYTMQKAFNKWKNVSRGMVDFEYVNSPDKADIKVLMVDTLGGSAAGVCGTSVKGDEIVGATIKLARTVNGTAQPNSEYYKVMLHEIGHSLGLPHTNRLNSIMNPTTTYAQLITGKDIQDLENLYKE